MPSRAAAEPTHPVPRLGQHLRHKVGHDPFLVKLRKETDQLNAGDLLDAAKVLQRAEQFISEQ